MNAEVRTTKLTVRVSERELEMMRQLADLDGLSVSDWLRYLVRKKHADAFGDKQPKRSK